MKIIDVAAAQEREEVDVEAGEVEVVTGEALHAAGGLVHAIREDGEAVLDTGAPGTAVE